MRKKKQYNRNNKSRIDGSGVLAWYTARNFNPALSLGHSLSGKVIELLHSYTRHPLFARNSAFTWQLEKAYGCFSKRERKREAFARILSSHSTWTLPMFKLWEEKTSRPLLIVEPAWNLMPDINERTPLWIKIKC